MAGLTLEDPNTVFGDYEKKVDVPKKTLIEDGKIYLAKSDGTKIDSGTTLPLGVKKEDLVVSNNSVTMTKSDVQNITISADTTVVLPSDVTNQELYLNVKCNTKDSILTFKNGTETTKLKLAANSYNVFQISANGSDYIIERKSTDYPELTEDEINAGISNEGIDLVDYQTKTDASLKTISKTIVGAINEHDSQINTITQEVGEEVLPTTSQTIKGAIAEVFQSASSGKSAIATAITGKGISASPEDTFEQLATKIQQISGGETIVSNTSLGEKMYSYAVVSDIHHGRNDYNVANDTINMLEGIDALNIDFVCGCGCLLYTSPSPRD